MVKVVDAAGYFLENYDGTMDWGQDGFLKSAELWLKE